MWAKGKGILLGISCLIAPGIALGASTFKVGNQISYYQGDYGTSQTTHIVYDETYLEYRQDRLSLRLVIPYEWVSGLPEGGVITSGGSVLNQSGKKSSSKTTTHSANGIGDVWLTGRYAVVPLKRSHPGVDVYSRVKFGTASYSDGLGTGENDYEFGVGITGYLAPRGYPFADVGYRFVGSPSGLSLDNVVTYDAGYEYAATRRSVLTAKFVGQQAELSDQSAPADLVLGWSYRLNERGGIQFFVDKGLSDGSPDYGLGVGAHLNF